MILANCGDEAANTKGTSPKYQYKHLVVGHKTIKSLTGYTKIFQPDKDLFLDARHRDINKNQIALRAEEHMRHHLCSGNEWSPNFVEIADYRRFCERNKQEISIAVRRLAYESNEERLHMDNLDYAERKALFLRNPFRLNEYHLHFLIAMIKPVKAGRSEEATNEEKKEMLRRMLKRTSRNVRWPI